VRLSDLDICFVAGTLGQGGAERQLYYALRALAGCGARARVLSLTRGEFWESRIRALDVEVTWIGQSGGRARRLRALLDVIRHDRPRILQSQHFFTNTYVALAARFLGIRGIGAIRSNSQDEIRLNGPLFGQLHLRLPRDIVANSRAAIENAIRRRIRPDRLHYLANVVDTDRFTPATQPQLSPPLRLLSVGRLGPEKRFDILLRAAARVKAALGPIALTVAGGGPLRDDLRQLARELGIAADVRFTGPLDSEAVSRTYGDADVFLLSSDFEGTPNVILEAMAAGLPVIATAVGGVPALVREDVHGFLVRPGSPEDLAAAVERVGRDAGMRSRFGAAARAHVEANHSLNSLPAALEGIYNAIAP
jgi:glycosyltransferase involved in cell wall biosynthesis